jgi:hypothetical protein
MKPLFSIAKFAGALFALSVAVPGAAFAIVLITAEEAALPPQKGAVPTSDRGITRGPKIQVSNKEGAYGSPMHLTVKFQTFGGSNVDLNALKVTYLKSPAVDLTTRVKPFVQAAGIDIPDAELPPGEHVVRVDIKDSDGRQASTSFVLKITP